MSTGESRPAVQCRFEEAKPNGLILVLVSATNELRDATKNDGWSSYEPELRATQQSHSLSPS